MTNMDKLYEAVEARGPVCVGLDTDFSYLPEDFVDSTLSRGENIVRFNRKLIDATKAVAGCYKVQIAYYESLGLELAGRFLGLQPIGKFVCGDIQRVDVHHQPAGDGVLVLGHNLHQIDFYVRIQQILDITHEKDYRDR